MDCGFPVTLPLRKNLSGKQGRYRIDQWIGARGWGRLYRGRRLGDDYPVIIKEYLLPANSFTPEEAHRRQATFQRLAGFSLAEARDQDFRLVPNLDAFAETFGATLGGFPSASGTPGTPKTPETPGGAPSVYRCYLVTPDWAGNDRQPLQPLSQYLSQHSAMNPLQVRDFLDQTLQTLQFLHHQKIRFPSGQLQPGMGHGNLSLDSLLFLQGAQQIYIYFTDFGAIESLFDPVQVGQVDFDPLGDLVTLGLIAIQLRTGQTMPLSREQGYGLLDRDQVFAVDPHLATYLKQVIGPEQGFDSAEAARSALKRLPSLNWEDTVKPEETIEPEESNRRLWWILGLGLLLALGGGWWRMGRLTANREDCSFCDLPPKFADVGDLPQGACTYSAQGNSTWSFLLNSSTKRQGWFSLFRNPQAYGGLLDQELPSCGSDQALDHEYRFDYAPTPVQGLIVRSIDNEPPCGPIQAVWNRDVDFAITSLSSEDWDQCPTQVSPSQQQLDHQVVGYNALLVYVPAIDDTGLLRDLAGRISLETLRKIYTGEVTNWSELEGPNLAIAPYAPLEPEARYLFRHTVLKDAPFVAQVQFERTENIVQNTQSGSIGFGIVSRVTNQCKAYPLALVNQGQTIQPLITDNGQPISLERTNLCQDRFGERIDYNVEVFREQTYPLGYPLRVVYPKDNSRSLAGLKFAELLQTQEGQQWLHSACETNKPQPGLIPHVAIVDQSPCRRP
jgi:ABC-type phosphate transport system substrate-binding protein